MRVQEFYFYPMDEKIYTLIDSNEHTLELSRKEICSMSEKLRCPCPENMLEVIECINRLIEEQSLCIGRSPDGFVVHSWLLNEAMRLERESLQILSELLQKEGVI